jgi:AcrR family transcriptional regulator
LSKRRPRDRVAPRGSARPRRTRMTGAERREQLLGVARELFAERGYEATSIEEIAERAGVSKPVVYEHFGAKGKIYTVIADREVAALGDRIKDALSPGHPRRTIVRAVEAFLTYIEEEEAGFRILVRDAPVGTGGGSLPSVLDEVAHAVEELLLTELKMRGYSRKMAPIMARCLVGMIALPGQWWSTAGGSNRKYVAAQIVNLAWNGLGNLQQDPS